LEAQGSPELREVGRGKAGATAWTTGTAVEDFTQVRQDKDLTEMTQRAEADQPGGVVFVALYSRRKNPTGIE
jgi:hypothetical protein